MDFIQLKKKQLKEKVITYMEGITWGLWISEIEKEDVVDKASKEFLVELAEIFSSHKEAREFIYNTYDEILSWK